MEPVIKFKTTAGNIVVKLYPETPKHRDNCVKLVEAGYYDGVLFHRVIADFMIQAGDPDSRNAKRSASLGSGDVKYTILQKLCIRSIIIKKERWLPLVRAIRSILNVLRPALSFILYKEGFLPIKS